MQWKLNYSRWLEAIGAVRYDNYSLESAANSSGGDHISPKATVGITPVDGLTVYGTIAEGYRAPAVTETLVAGPHPPFAVGFPNLFTLLPNPGLQPEVGRTKEIGLNVKYDGVFVAGDKLRAKVNVFRNDVSNFIELVNFGPPVTFCPAPFPGCPPVPRIVINSTSLAQYQNIGEGRIEGIEFEGNYDAPHLHRQGFHHRAWADGTLLGDMFDHRAGVVGHEANERRVLDRVEHAQATADSAGCTVCRTSKPSNCGCSR